MDRVFQPLANRAVLFVQPKPHHPDNDAGEVWRQTMPRRWRSVMYRLRRTRLDSGRAVLFGYGGPRDNISHFAADLPENLSHRGPLEHPDLKKKYTQKAFRKMQRSTIAATHDDRKTTNTASRNFANSLATVGRRIATWPSHSMTSLLQERCSRHPQRELGRSQSLYQFSVIGTDHRALSQAGFSETLGFRASFLPPRSFPVTWGACRASAGRSRRNGASCGKVASVFVPVHPRCGPAHRSAAWLRRSQDLPTRDPVRCPSTESPASFRAGSWAGSRDHVPATGNWWVPADGSAGTSWPDGEAGCP